MQSPASSERGELARAARTVASAPKRDDDPAVTRIASVSRAPLDSSSTSPSWLEAEAESSRRWLGAPADPRSTSEGGRHRSDGEAPAGEAAEQEDLARGLGGDGLSVTPEEAAVHDEEARSPPAGGRLTLKR